jgi:hypothetical protein
MLSDRKRNSARCTHRPTWTRWQLAGCVVRCSNCKGGHELLNISLAEWTIDVALLLHHQLIKGIFAVIAVIFEYWHKYPPYFLGIHCNIITQSPCGKGERVDCGLRIVDCKLWIADCGFKKSRQKELGTARRRGDAVRRRDGEVICY